VISTVPDDGDEGVATNANIATTFSENMEASTINETTFTLRQGPTPVSGNVTYVGGTAIFDPDSNLAPNTEFTATITTGAENPAGKALASPYEWSFTTGQGADETAPEVISTLPDDDATDVAVNTNITATFNEAMLPSTINETTFTLQQGLTPVAGDVTYPGGIATFNPDVNLDAGTEYTATITVGATDLAGNPLAAPHVWTFETGAAADSTPPEVTGTVPLDDATGVGTNANITATFNEAMLPSTINDTNFTLRRGLTPVAGAVTYPGGVATFNPDAGLASATTYTATITTGATDLAGNPLASDYEWSFKTGQAPIDLGAAGNFAILAGSAVTNTGGSVISGDLGVSPGSAVPVFPPGVLNGTIHAGDGVAAAAKLALNDAYIDAVAHATEVITLSDQELGGRVLSPGLYKSGSSYAITLVDLTLDAGGNPDAVFIFQMPSSTLTVLDYRKVILVGVNPDNIYWQVGSSATLGTYCEFKGNILASASISAQTGAWVVGRLLTQTGAVTLDTNVVTLP
jgi:hypothetical protein